MEADGTHEAVENIIREGFGLAVQVAAHRRNTQTQKLLQARRDANDDRMSTTLATLTAKQNLDSAQAATTLQSVQDPEWWDKTPASEIVDTYRQAWQQREFPPSQDGSDATRTVNTMDEELLKRYGFSGQDVAPGDLSASQAQERYTAILDHLKGFDAKGAGIADGLQTVSDLHMASFLSAAAHPHSIEQVTAAAASESREPEAQIDRGGIEQGAQREEGR